MFNLKHNLPYFRKNTEKYFFRVTQYYFFPILYSFTTILSILFLEFRPETGVSAALLWLVQNSMSGKACLFCSVCKEIPISPVTPDHSCSFFLIFMIQKMWGAQHHFTCGLQIWAEWGLIIAVLPDLPPVLWQRR